ncbi:MAG: peptide ABC transporter substrate-binding protein [Verrucomicrobia bacterium]|nr:peptide ABC transporter substrate-binding protein [Verrucomicrobiota bacterium]
MCSFISCQKPEKKEQSLRFSLVKEPVSLDPRIGNETVATQIHFMLYEGLLKLNPDMSLSPAQAKSYEISNDRTTYTFHLDKATWSNGDPVTAYDFERSWKSLLSPKFPCPDAYLLYSIKNAEKTKKGAASLNEVGIRALDSQTLQVELEAPSPYFLQIVASSVLLPVHESIDDSKNIVSNGPFTLKEWRLNQEIILEKNPSYLHASDVKLNQIAIEIIPREMAALHMYASGHFDLVGAPLSLFPTILHEDIEKKKLASVYPVAMTKFLAFNTASFPFNNANLRRAFAYAVSRKEIVEQITQLYEKEALNIIPPILVPNQETSLFTDDDAKKAKEYFQKALDELKVHPKDLTDISFMYVASELNHLLAQELQERWSKLFGVRITIEGIDFKSLQERSKTGKYSIGIFVWLADYGDPMNILERFQDRTNHRNYSKWQSAEYNKLIQQALQAPDRTGYLAKIQEAERLLIDEMPVTGLFHDNYVFLLHPYVRGFAVSPLGHIYFERISIDTAKKSY